MPHSVPKALEMLIVREIRAVKREIEAYPDEPSVWRAMPGLPNTGGTLALHLAGNLQHFFGAILGRDGYRRDRDAEFSRRDVPRREILEQLDAAITSVQRTLRNLDKGQLPDVYPEPVAKRRLASDAYMLHLLSHLAYHLGQIDYHRRAVTGDARAVDAVSVRELPETA